ncbi:MAG TPA: LamG-like jellyroll fold domain-containing protein, partial [Flavobacterium sp.]|nr:LamG-like jellyroll fold domain-containing protein [Flavobacterium sp.]
NFPIGNTINSFTVTDAAGNSINCSFTVTVVDNIFPTLTPGANQTANTTAGLCTAPIAVTNAVFNDNCPGSTISYELTGATIKSSTIGQVGTFTFNKGVTLITYTVTDAVGNSTSLSKTITIVDSINPTIVSGSNHTANTDPGFCYSTVVVADAVFNDNCPGSTISYELSGATIKSSTVGQVGTYLFNKGVTTITYTVIDAALRTVTASKTVTVTDNINPTLTPGIDQTANTAIGLCTASVMVTDAVFNDNCSGSTISYTLSGATLKSSTVGQVGTYTFNKGVTTITYTVTDAVGRTVTGTKTITVIDNVSPTLTTGTNQTANTASGLCTASVVVTNAIFNDNCTGSTISYTLSGATIKASTVGQVGTYTFNKGVTTITYTVLDAVGNSTIGSKTVTVTDNIFPTLTPGANQTANTTAGLCTAPIAVSNAVFNDNCPGSTISYELSGATVSASTVGQLGTFTFNKGVTTITYTVIDAVGNTTKGSKTITIVDSINPTIVSGSNQSANTDPGFCYATVVVADAVFNDNCPGSTISYSLTGATIKSSTVGQVGTYPFNKGVTTITYTVTDAASRTVTGSKTVTVTDNINPIITPGVNLTVNTAVGLCTASAVVSDAVFNDNCSGFTISHTLTGATIKSSTVGQVGTYTFNKGVTTITYTVTDAVGRTVTGTKTITVIDNVSPTLTPGTNQTANTASGLCTASVAVTNAIFNDNCTGSTISYTLSGATIKASTTGQVGTYTFNKGVTTITYTVLDAVGNSTIGSKTVTVIDNILPVATLSNVTAQCGVTLVPPTATDNCAGTIIGTTSDPLVYTTQGTYMVTWLFNDGNGNSITRTQNVIIDDTIAPVKNVNTLPNLSFSACQINSLVIPTATDNCVGLVNATPNISFPFSTQGTTVVTWTYNDGNGNISTQTQNITLTKPAISGGSLLGYPSDIYGVDKATDNIAITSCPNDINPIVLNLSGEIGTIVRWEKFEVGDATWSVIKDSSNNPITSDNYNTIFDFTNTKSTLFRVLVQVEDCTEYSNMVNVHAIPPDVPPVLEQNYFNICLNDQVTLIAHSGFNSTINVDNGGDYNQGQFPNKWDPTQWKIDGQVAGTAWTAAGNNTNFNNWSGTNNHPVGTKYRIEYDSNDFKFGIAHGNYNSPEYIAAFPPGNPTTLETPIFSLVGQKTATVDFDQAFNLHAGDICKVELSLDGGLTYTVVLQNLIGTSPQALSWGDTNGAPVPYPYLLPKPNNSTTTYFDFQDDNTSFDLSEYIGNDNVRVRWTFFGTTDESVWAIDNITIPVKPYSDELEWTDGLGSPGEYIIRDKLDVAYTFAPTAPGVHEYGATSLVNGCRAYDPQGTAIATVVVNYAYAGEAQANTNENCGERTVQLNAYDNTKTADENKGNNAYPLELNSYSDDPGSGETGKWTVFNTTNTCGTYSFSDDTSPTSSFSGDAGVYTLRWTLDNSGCFSDVQITLTDCNVVDFEGIDDYISFKNNYNLGSSFSIEVWVKPEPQAPGAPSVIQSIISKRNANNLIDGYDLRLVGNTLSFNWNNGSKITSPNLLSTSRWYHVAVTYNDGVYNLYVDGILVTSSAGTAPLTNNYECILGAMDQAGNPPNKPENYYSGWIDELRIWNQCLTPDHIRQMMNQQIIENGLSVRGEIVPIDINGPDKDIDGIDDKPIYWSDLMGYYRMDQIECGYLKPYNGKGVDGKLRNITTSQEETAPLPYTTIRNGDWMDRGLGTTPWKFGATVWDYPNSTGYNDTPIDWNIVKIGHDINSKDKDITVLGLISDAGKFTVADPIVTSPIEKNTGQSLWITHYLLLNGNIDLVGESQLLEKRYTETQFSESLLDESSLGFIKRDQQGKQNSFNYNYWCSPVSIQGGLNNSLYSVASVLKDGTDSSNPKNIVFGDTVSFADGPLTSPIKITNRWIWSYNSQTPYTNTDAQNYFNWFHIKSSGLLKTGDGFIMKGSGGVAPIDTLQNYSFIGKPNSGTISSPLPLNQTHLVGNPYPSAIDANELILDNLADRAGVNVFNGALYFWDHFGLSNTHVLSTYEGGYATYTLIGGVKAVNNSSLTLNDGANGIKIPGRYIPVGQGFLIKALSEANLSGTVPVINGGLFSFKNSQRVFERENSSNSVFMKMSNKENSENTNATIRLGFDSSVGTHRQILIGVNERTTNLFDIGYDAPMIDVNKNDMYWLIENDKFVIQGVPEFYAGQIIPIGLSIANEGISVIKIDELENFPETLDIFIHDGLTDTKYDIRKNNFGLAFGDGDYSNRFSLRFENQETLNVAENNINIGIVAFYKSIKNELVIQNKKVDVMVKTVQLFNILGQLMATWDVKHQNQSNIEIPIKTISSGIYIAKINTSKGDISVKFVVK